VTTTTTLPLPLWQISLPCPALPCLCRQSTVQADTPDGFNALTDLLQTFPLLHSSHFIFVPGPLDPWAGTATALPRPALPAVFSLRLTQRLPRARFVSNPCRIRYFGQEIVVCREDMMGRMMRGLVAVKEEGADMKRYVSFIEYFGRGVGEEGWIGCSGVVNCGGVGCCGCSATHGFGLYRRTGSLAWESARSQHTDFRIYDTRRT
jgi:hypothetical protein